MRFVSLGRRHWDWLHARTGINYISDTKGVAAESNKGTILGVCACDTWTITGCQIHIAIDNPICLKNERFQKEVFNYIFGVARRKMAIGIIPANNERALRFDRKLGFREVYRIPDGSDEGVDLVIMILRKEDWENRHG